MIIPTGLLFLLRDEAGPGAEPTPAPAPTVSATATASAPATAEPTASAPATPPAPNGRIAAATLRNATLDIPPWPADNLDGPSGRIKFTDGEAYQPPSPTVPYHSRLAIYDITYGDVDRDGAEETVATVFCGYEGGSVQLLAFDRNAEGAIVTLGTVVSTTGEVRALRGDTARVLADGTVQVQVGDYPGLLRRRDAGAVADPPVPLERVGLHPVRRTGDVPGQPGGHRDRHDHR